MKTESRKCNDNVLGDRGNKMNWKSIKKKYPKAFKLLDKTVDIFWDCRFLYDFFDEQGIIIQIKFFWKAEILKKKWSYEISNDFEYIYSSNLNDSITYSNRIEAEEQAFLKAFEILEEKIK
jgi:hypothetical protein